MKKKDGGDLGKILDTGSDMAKTFSSKHQGTERLKIDMMSDTPLSKNVRPIIAIWSMALLTLMLTLNSFNIALDPEVKETIFWVSIIVMGFYFPGRSVDKWTKRRYKD